MNSKVRKLIVVGLLALAGGAEEPPTMINSLDMTFIALPAGSYVVGPPDVPRETAMYAEGNPLVGETVRIPRGLWLCRHEVRVRDYRAFCAATKRKPPRGEGYRLDDFRWVEGFEPMRDDAERNLARPISCVTLADAEAFCAWLSTTEGRRYRLPTEVEWEYAARAGSDLPYSTEAAFNVLLFNGGCGHSETTQADPVETVLAFGLEDTPAGSAMPSGQKMTFKANRWGFYHMLGNVAEIVARSEPLPVLPLYRPLPGTTMLPGRTNVMLRGGSWLHWPEDLTVYRATWFSPPRTNCAIGFRVLLVAD